MSMLEKYMKINICPEVDIPTVDPCSSRNCNHGRCVSSGSAATCNCDFGWTGTDCDTCEITYNCFVLLNENELFKPLLKQIFRFVSPKTCSK